MHERSVPAGQAQIPGAGSAQGGGDSRESACVRLGGPGPRRVAVASDHVRSECLLPVLSREVGVALPSQCAKPRTHSGSCGAQRLVQSVWAGAGWAGSPGVVTERFSPRPCRVRMRRALRLGAPPVGLAKNCRRSSAHDHTLPYPRCQHSTHSLPGPGPLTLPLRPPRPALDALSPSNLPTPPPSWGQSLTRSILAGLWALPLGGSRLCSRLSRAG